MQTVGEILKNARIEKKLSLKSLSSITKIPPSTLKALEKNQFNLLPSKTYLSGFIRNYAKAVDLDPQKTVAIFRRDYQTKLNKPILPKGVTKPLNSKLASSPLNRNLVGIITIVIIFLSYLGFAWYQLSKPPQLTLAKPENGQELTNPVLVKGKTNHDASLTLNGKTVNLEPDGQFTTVFNGPVGTHELKLISTSRRNKSSTVTRHIIIKQ